MYTRLVLMIFCFIVCLHDASAQEAVSATTQTNAVERLDSIGRRMESHLASLPAYEVDVKQQWKVDGDHQTQGMNRFLLIHRHDGAFKLKAGNEDGQNSTLTCLGDGKTITRVLEFEDQFIHAQKPGGLSELLQDVMTDHSLRYSGLDLLCREHPLHYIMTMASEAKYIGEEQLPAGRADHFQMEWGEGDSHQMDLWFSTGDAPLLVRSASAIEFQPDENVKHTITATADLSWKTGQQYADAEFHAQMPTDSIEVADLYSYLADGGTIDLLGKPAPKLDLKTLDGTAWNLETHQGKEIVVLYFFATWAAPSRQEVPELLQAMQQREVSGVAFYAVNVGESAAAVQSIVDAYQYDRPVILDPQRQAAKALRVTSLPTMVVIGRDGTIQAAHVGNTAVIRQQIQADLDKLISGDRLVPLGE